eukprot:6182015-Pleurochrysis_carterae.AAC.1
MVIPHTYWRTVKLVREHNERKQDDRCEPHALSSSESDSLRQWWIALRHVPRNEHLSCAIFEGHILLISWQREEVKIYRLVRPKGRINRAAITKPEAHAHAPAETLAYALGEERSRRLEERKEA